jgi:abelson tyrosine-protein kinase 1
LTVSNKGDSESDLQDQTPDTDDSGAHSYPEAPTGAFGQPGATSSFKRAPIMGNRGLEQRGKKSRTYPPKDTASAQKVCVWFRVTQHVPSVVIQHFFTDFTQISLFVEVFMSTFQNGCHFLNWNL